MIIEKVNGPVFVVNGGSMDNEFDGGLSIPNNRSNIFVETEE